MGRIKRFENGFKVVKVYVQPEEHERFLEVCGESLSDWARNALVTAAMSEHHSKSKSKLKDTCDNLVSSLVGSNPTRVAGARRAVQGERTTGASVSQQKSKTCIHGIQMGYNCWQCGGLAKR